MKITRSIEKVTALLNLKLLAEEVANQKSGKIVELVFMISTIRLENNVNTMEAIAGLGSDEEVFYIAEPKIEIARVSDGTVIDTVDFMKLLHMLGSETRQGFKDYKFLVSSNKDKTVNLEEIKNILI